ncbi:Hexokinase-1 [Fusarium oxysporum f. sp. albedinis]|nr:Hexokinase-1 [Fusarium oxysporum f. sp. albedinis]
MSVNMKYPGLTFMRWLIKSFSSNTVPIASDLAKLGNLRQGYRLLPLSKSLRNSIQGGYRICKISII